MKERFTVTVVVEHGYPHYKIVDALSKIVIHCDINELNKTLNELSE